MNKLNKVALYETRMVDDDQIPGGTWKVKKTGWWLQYAFAPNSERNCFLGKNRGEAEDTVAIQFSHLCQP
jgi:hypothetical protein